MPNKTESPKSLTQNRIIDKTEDPFLKTVEEINRYILRYKFLNCLRIEADGFCGYWQLNELPERVKQLNQKEAEYLFKKLNQDNGKTEAWSLR